MTFWFNTVIASPLMNKLPGTIIDNQLHGQLRLLRIKVGSSELSSIGISGKLDQQWHNGSSVSVVFKENEVSILKGEASGLSMQNKLMCHIKSIETGVLLSRLELKHQSFNLTAVITSRAVEQLGLQIGDQVYALIKTNELMLEP